VENLVGIIRELLRVVSGQSGETLQVQKAFLHLAEFLWGFSTEEKKISEPPIRIVFQKKSTG
jgi:hypothetical protein